MRPLVLSLLFFTSGCALVRSPEDRLAKNRSGSDFKSWLGFPATPAGEGLEIGQYCQFDFAEGDAKASLPGFLSPSRSKTRIGGRIVSIDSDHVLLTDVVEIVDSSSASTTVDGSQGGGGKTPKRPVGRALSGDPNKEFKFPLRKMEHVKMLDR